MAPVNDTPTVAPTSTSEGYRALFIDRFSRYTSQSSACGFFYRFSDGPHCRIEAADIRLEFVDVREFGRDPEGTLFYNNLSDLNGAMDYRFWVNSGTTDDEAAVVAQFYKKGGNSFVAEFVAKDPARTVNDTVVDHTGIWRAFPYQENTATLTKSAGSNSITLHIAIVNFRATWTPKVPISAAATACAINQQGKVLIRDISGLSSGRTSFIDYNDDRILFFPQQPVVGGRSTIEFSLVFLPIIPSGGNAKALCAEHVGTQTNSGVVNYIQVQWS